MNELPEWSIEVDPNCVDLRGYVRVRDMRPADPVGTAVTVFKSEDRIMWPATIMESKNGFTWLSVNWAWGEEY